MADLFSERRSKTTRSPYLVGNKTLNATFANQMKTNLVLTLAAASAVLAASSAPCAGQARHRAHRQPSTLQAKPESSRLGKIPPLPRRRPTKKGENEKNAKERNAKEKWERPTIPTASRQSEDGSTKGPHPETQAGKGKRLAPAVEPPESAVAWSTDEVLAARARCVEILAPITAEVTVGPAVRAGACGTPDPVVVDSIGGNVRVAMRPPVTVNCRMVVALHAWLEKDVQPAARDLLGEEITEIRGATGYQCRNRADTGRTSEHGFANAIDIFGFVTRSGRQLSVRDDWGPPERVLGQADDQTGDEPQTEPEFRRSAENMTRQRKRVASQAPSPLPKKGKATRRSFASVEPTPASDRADLTAEQRFLKRIHREACSPFKTVLGPDANDDHLGHFHLDLAEQQNKSSYCQ